MNFFQDNLIAQDRVSLNFCTNVDFVALVPQKVVGDLLHVNVYWVELWCNLLYYLSRLAFRGDLELGTHSTLVSVSKWMENEWKINGFFKKKVYLSLG